MQSPHCRIVRRLFYVAFLNNTLIEHPFGSTKTGKRFGHFRCALYSDGIAIVYKSRKTDFNRASTSNRRNRVPTFDVSSWKCPIPRKVLSDSIFVVNLRGYAWYSRDKIVPLCRERVFTARDVRQRAFLILFSSGFVPFLSRQGFISRYKVL